MKNSFYFFSVIFILVLSFACSKDKLDCDKARLQGKVLEKGSNKPLVGWTVYFSTCDCVLLGGCNCELKDSTTTDSKGSYSYDYAFGNTGDLFAYPKVQEGFLIYDYRVLGSYRRHRTETKDILIVPKAWIKFHIFNDKPFDQFDQFSLNGSYHYGGDINLGGDNANKYFKRLVDGNDTTSITQYTTKNDKLVIKRNKIYVPAHDTTFYEIKY